MLTKYGKAPYIFGATLLVGGALRFTTTWHTLAYVLAVVGFSGVLLSTWSVKRMKRTPLLRLTKSHLDFDSDMVKDVEFIEELLAGYSNIKELRELNRRARRHQPIGIYNFLILMMLNHRIAERFSNTEHVSDLNPIVKETLATALHKAKKESSDDRLFLEFCERAEFDVDSELFAYNLYKRNQMDRLIDFIYARCRGAHTILAA